MREGGTRDQRSAEGAGPNDCATNVVVGIIEGIQTYDYWNHSITTHVNPAKAGSALLAYLGTISAIKLWLEPLKFVGIAMLLSGIDLALATIVRILR